MDTACTLLHVFKEVLFSMERVHSFYEILKERLSQKIKSHQCRGEERHFLSYKAVLVLMSDNKWVICFNKSSLPGEGEEGRCKLIPAGQCEISVGSGFP